VVCPFSRNLDFDAYIVNGSTGYVRAINYEKSENEDGTATDEPFSILIDLDDGGQYEVKRVTAIFQVGPNLYVTRTQFPISPCYAATIHKAQSITRNNIMFSLTAAHDVNMRCCILFYALFSILLNPARTLVTRCSAGLPH
jgi:ATP-dependent exoDNAse (exonuclease V) alpha subunit